MSKDAVVGDEEVFVATDLFSRFYNACGNCHVDGNFGGLKVSLVDFKPGSSKVGRNMLDRMLEETPALVMPPVFAGGTINSQRQAGDPVIQLIVRYRQWVEAGQPADVFRVKRDNVPPGAGNKYLMTLERGMAMTNVGDCIPGSGLVGAMAPASRAAELDTKFAAGRRAAPGSPTPVPDRIGLPERLADTDLSTLDTSLLAQDRVVAYAPTYPLWSDNARKIRHIRVPLGQSIRFDKQTQTFDIPPNTRFYKTFLKPVIEKGGSLRYRKIETRLIVARPDGQGADGKAETTALFGTYKWDEAEQEATLVTETLNNLEPFKDQLLTLIIDEEKADAVRASLPAGENLAIALENARATRKYAIPGSERCIQCHLGSPTKNFILGFFPLQVRRRPAGEGGIIEPAGPDELSQVERLMSYGIITGLDSPTDILGLEASQGMRKPRNDYELTAQGYALGNCAHCHNPRGFPSVENPVLRDIFNFLPDADPVQESEVCRKQGGIFQFPLGCTSPRIQRGQEANVPIPYITPSLVDYPNTDGSSDFPKEGVFAPWRSLVYRNVDTPFTYSDGGAIFPHMPMNVPGFDCRAPRVFGEWMVSIPGVRTVSPQLDEVRYDDPTPQPYKEVKPTEPTYARALTDAHARLSRYQWGIGDAWWAHDRYSRHAFCPDTSNIQDPHVTLEDNQHLAPPDETVLGPGGKVVMPDVGTPRRAHWVVSDMTQPRVDGWNPRRDDWMKVLIHDCLCNETKAECRNADGRTNRAYACLNSDPGETAKKRAQARLVGILKGADPASGVRLTDAFRTFASQPIPFGLWQQRSNCNYSSTRSVAYWRNPPADRVADRPKWVDIGPAPVPGEAPVYELSRGAAVFSLICINCHGAQADSRGRMADTVLTMTGGSTRVANLREGVFGASGANRTGVFGAVSNANANSDDWAGRYLAWMALGGTTKVLPLPVLDVVANTGVLGVKRKGVTAVADANMLETAKHMCRYMLPSREGIRHFDPKTASFDYLEAVVPPIATNGDLELWQRLCTTGNAAPVRAMLFTETGGRGSLGPNTLGIMRPESYPPTAPVGNHLGKIELGIQPGNLMPWCWNVSGDVAKGEAYARENAIDGQPLPQCPPGFGVGDSDANRLTDEEKEAWAERGAVNAGLAVFVYLDDLAKGKARPVTNYADCPVP